MEKKDFYEAPLVKVVQVEVEQGFAVSFTTGGFPEPQPEQYQSINAGGDFI